MRIAALLLAASLGALGLVAAAPLTPLGAGCAAAGPHHAAIVVEHGDGTVVRRCVAFAGDSVTGEQLLAASGIEYQTQTFGGFGDAICQLDAEPAAYTDCLGTSRYWAYFVARAGAAWQFSSAGISTVTLHDGDAEGFRYLPTTGSASPPAAPGPCPAAVPTPMPATAAPTVAAATRPTSATRAPTAGAPTASIASTASAEPSGSSAAESTAPPSAVTPAASTDSASTGPSGTPGSGAETRTSTTGGPDGGLLAAGVAGAGLIGLALLRAIGRRRSRP